MLHLVDVSKAFGTQDLFAHGNLHIAPGDRIGLVGPNGSGKTSLFRLITGELAPDEGELRRRKHLRVGYLAQEIEPRREGRVLQSVVDGVRGLGALRHERAEVMTALHAENSGQDADALAARLASLEEAFERAGGYAVEGEARAVLAGLGFTAANLERPLRTFSGGWQVRAELARLLLDQPDLLLLDEPTNHLDLESIEWFENYLAAFRGAFALVSHDREFLNRAVSRIVEVRRDGFRAYSGGYDTYRRRRAEDEALQEKHFKEQQARIREIEDFVARNRVRKDRARQVQSRLKALSQIERIEAPHREGSIHFQFPQPERSGDQVILLEGAGKRYGDNCVFDGLDLTVRRGQRIAVVGPNGAGKSTLLKMLAGILPLDAGRRTLGSNVTVDYFAQHQVEALDPAKSVLEEVHRRSSVLTAPAVRGILGAFRFSGDDVEKRVSVLSGGEKSRLALAKMLLRPANLLLMDEPTNHLDIGSREMLERALAAYDGTLVLTSHDRRFIDTVANIVLEVHRGHVAVYPGNYSDYAWKRQAEGQRPAGTAESSRDAESAPTPHGREAHRARKRREAEHRVRLGRALKPLRRERKQLEGDIETCEAQIGKMETLLADPELYRDGERARRAVAKHESLCKNVQKLYERWGEVEAEIEDREALLTPET